MKVAVEQVSHCRRKVNVEVPLEDVSVIFKNVTQRYAKQARVPGFRQGKVPVNIIKDRYADAIKSEVIEKVLNQTYAKALDQGEVEPVYNPMIDQVELAEGTAMTYSIILDVKPAIKLKKYQGLKVEKPLYPVNESQVDESLAHLQEQFTQYVEPADASAALKLDDMAVVDFKMVAEGEVLSEENDFSLVLNKERALVELVEQMVGMAVGDAKSIVVTLPESYPDQAYANKKATVDVTLKAIKERKVPALDDDFARDLGEFQSMQELRERILKDLEQSSEQKSLNELKDNLVKELIEHNDFEPPLSLVEYQQKAMAENMAKNWRQQGIQEEFIKQQMDFMVNDFKDRATDVVKMQYLLDAVAEAENISVGQTDIDAKIEEMAKAMKQNESVLKERLSKDGTLSRIEDQLKDEKVFDFLIAEAKIKEKVVKDKK